MSGEDNKAVVQAYVQAFNRGDMESLRALFTADAVVYGVLGGGPLDVAEPIWRQLHEALNVQLEVTAMIAEGDTVAVRYVERGTSVKPFMDHPATGKGYELVAMEWFVIKDGRIHRRWGARDSAAQFRQMGFTEG